MRGKDGKIVYSIKLKGQIILPNTDPYPLRLFKPVDIPPKKGIKKPGGWSKFLDEDPSRAAKSC